MAVEQITFQCNLPERAAHVVFPEKVGSRPTFGLVTSDADWLAKRDRPEFMAPGMPQGIGVVRRMKRKVFTSGKFVMWDGEVVPHWGFEDEHGQRDFPSSPVRLAGGDLLQAQLKSSKRQHTIHWHGIEPDVDNDGVGHTSFEVTGSYTYQWRAHPASAGSFFYHCHVNTSLHVQMGLFGPLIIYPTGTDLDAPRKKPFPDAPDDWTYDGETFWAAYAADPAWHKLNHAAGQCGEDVGMNNYEPKYFMINKYSQDPDGPPLEQPAIHMKAGETHYLRVVNAAYFPVQIEFGGGLNPLIIEADGRPLRDRIDLSGLPGDGKVVGINWNDISHRMSPAQRYGFLFRAPVAGTYSVELIYRHWITQEVAGVARTTVTVS